MDLIFTVFTHAVALGIGVWGYRYMAKRDPALVAKWAADLKNAGTKVEGFFD